MNDKLDQQKAEVELILQNYEERNYRKLAERNNRTCLKHNRSHKKQDIAADENDYERMN